MFSADFVNLANIKASATIEITTIENKASCDIKKGFRVNDCAKVQTFNEYSKYFLMILTMFFNTITN
jgi:hypothetical protein